MCIVILTNISWLISYNCITLGGHDMHILKITHSYMIIIIMYSVCISIIMHVSTYNYIHNYVYV